MFAELRKLCLGSDVCYHAGIADVGGEAKGIICGGTLPHLLVVFLALSPLPHLLVLSSHSLIPYLLSRLDY